MEKWWIFTFGCGQPHAGQYVRIFGTFRSARALMFERYGDQWAFQYSEEQWADWENRRPPYLPVETERESIGG